MKDIPPSKPNELSAAEIDSLISEGKLLRILQPTLQTQMRQALQDEPSAQPFFLESDGQLYLSMDLIEDDQSGIDYYQLIQHYQVGEPVDLQGLPPQVQRVLQPDLTGPGRFLGAILIGAVAGIITGVLAMALTSIFSGGLALFSREPTRFIGMELGAVSFILFTFAGWISIATLAWRKPHLWVRRRSGGNAK